MRTTTEARVIAPAPQEEPLSQEDLAWQQLEQRAVTPMDLSQKPLAGTTPTIRLPRAAEVVQSQSDHPSSPHAA